jgi:hypothetical protein
MAAHYVLRRMALNSTSQLPIAEEQYQTLRTRLDELVHICEVEEKYAAVIENYFEFELDLLQEALRAMVFKDLDDVELQAPKFLASRRLINLLTSARLYLDTLPQHAACILTEERLEKIKNAPSVAYDSSLAYRVMEALRNYSQHEALPVHNWTVGGQWNEKVEPPQLGFSVEPALDLNILAHSPKFKRSVLGELAKTPEPLRLKPYVREYVGLLSSVQARFRNATSKSRENWAHCVTSAETAFSVEFGEVPQGLVAMPLDERGHIDGKPVHLSAPAMKYIDYLQRRTGEMVNYSHRCVVY